MFNTNLDKKPTDDTVKMQEESTTPATETVQESAKKMWKDISTISSAGKRTSSGARLAEAWNEAQRVAEETDRLVEKWASCPYIFDGTGVSIGTNKSVSDSKARAIARQLESTLELFATMSEADISKAYNGLVQQQILKVIARTHGVAKRSEIFTEMSATAMTNQTMYFIDPTYDSSVRGATKGTVAWLSKDSNYASERNRVSLGTGNGVLTTFTVNLTSGPVRPFGVNILQGLSSTNSVNYTQVGADDGNGNISGPTIAANSVVDYTNAPYEITVNFTAPIPAGVELFVEYRIDLEETANYGLIGEMGLSLRKVDFRAQPNQLIMTLPGHTYNVLNSIDVNGMERLMIAISDEVAKSIDYYMIRQAFGAASAKSPIVFDASTSSTGITDPKALAENIKVKGFERAANRMKEAIERGGVNVIVGGPNAVSYLSQTYGYRQESIERTGVYLNGYINGNIPVYGVSSEVMPDNALMPLYKNDNDPAVALVTYLPFFSTDNLHFAQNYYQQGFGWVGDSKVVTPEYLEYIRIDNLTV